MKEQPGLAPPLSWGRAPLSELCAVVRERLPPATRPDLPFIGLEHVQPHSMRLLGAAQAQEMRSAAVHFEKGDVLYGRLRPYLNKVVTAAFEGLCSAEFIPLTARDGVVPRFVQYRLNATDFVSFASHLNEGDRPRVDWGQMGAFQITVPPSSEQRRIVDAVESYLSRLDEAEAALERVQRNLERCRAAVLQAAVEGRLVPTEAELARAEGRDYESASDLLKRILTERHRRWEDAELARLTGAGKPPLDDKWKAKYQEPESPKAEALPVLTEGWCWVTVDTLARARPNAICAGPFGTIFKARDFRPAGVPIIFLRHVKPDRYLTTKPAFMDDDRWRALFRDYSVHGGELLVSKLGDPPGDCAVYPESLGVAMLTPDVMKLDVDAALAVPRYVMYYLNSAAARRVAFGAAFGTTRLRLTLPLFRETPVPLPPINEQRRIVLELDRRFTITDGQVSAVASSLGRSGRLRQSILKWAFEGRLVDQDPNDEPASVLLARIRQETAASAEGTAKPRKARARKAR